MSSTPLSVVLEARPKMLPFDELMVDIPSEDHIKYVLLDIVTYLDSLLDLLVLVLSPDHELAWYLEGRDAILDIVRTCDNIDTLMSQLLNTLESVVETSVLEFLLTEFDEVSDLILEVKKVVLYYKRNLDTAMAFADNESTITGITREIEDLIKIVVKIRERTISDHPPYFGSDFTEVCSNLKINDSPTSNKLRTLPTVNPQHTEAYQDYVMAESRINAVIISLDILPAKLDELNNMCQGEHEMMRNEHVDNYEILFQRWEFLQTEMQRIKADFVDTHWRQAYTQLVEATKPQVVLASWRLDECTSHWKIISNAMAIIRSGVSESWIPADPELEHEFEKLQAAMDRDTTSPSTSRRISSGTNSATPGGLRQFHTARAVLALFDILAGGNLIELKLGKRRSLGDRQRLGEKRISSEPSPFIQRLSQSQSTPRNSQGSNDASGSLSRNLGNSSFSVENAHRRTSRDSLDSTVGVKDRHSSFEHHNNSDYDMSYEAIDESFEAQQDPKNTASVEQKTSALKTTGDNILSTIGDEDCQEVIKPISDEPITEEVHNDLTRLCDTMERTQITPKRELDSTHEPIIDKSVGAGIASRDSLTTDEEDTLLEKVSVPNSLVELSRVPSLHSTKPETRPVNVEELFVKLMVPHRPLGLPYMVLDYFERGLTVVKKQSDRGSMLPTLLKPRKITMPPRAYYAPQSSYNKGMIV